MNLSLSYIQYVLSGLIKIYIISHYIMVRVLPTLLQSICSSMNFRACRKTFLVDDNDDHTA